MKGFYGTFKELSLRLQWKIKSKLTSMYNNSKNKRFQTLFKSGNRFKVYEMIR